MNIFSSWILNLKKNLAFFPCPHFQRPTSPAAGVRPWPAEEEQLPPRRRSRGWPWTWPKRSARSSTSSARRPASKRNRAGCTPSGRTAATTTSRTGTKSWSWSNRHELATGTVGGKLTSETFFLSPSRDYKVRATGMKQWYLLSVFIGDYIRDVQFCKQLAKRLACDRNQKEFVRD